jgi:hypothetical protein
VKLTVVTESGGKVVGTMRQLEESGTSVTSIEPGEGQEVKEVDVPGDIANLESVEEFHRALGQHLES